jgi:ATP-binding cassette subfamily C (CFTR/MRP) protein 1
MKQTIRFVIETPVGTGTNYGDWLIVSAVAIYFGLAVSSKNSCYMQQHANGYQMSTSVYQQRLNRLKLATRSAIVGLVHDKTIKSRSLSYDDGESTTLMSTDADSLDGIAEMVHETWAQIIEVMVGIVLLAREVGWIWPLPLFLIYSKFRTLLFTYLRLTHIVCSHVSRYVAKHLAPRQKEWNSATQSRVAATSSMLGSMKSIKMLGFQSYIASRIQELRKGELLIASKLRWVMVYYNASG